MEKRNFEVLEIEPTRDIKEIKRAYYRLLKKYHPEEYPKKIMEINVAYEEAMKYAKDSSETFWNYTENTNDYLNNHLYHDNLKKGEEKAKADTLGSWIEEILKLSNEKNQGMFYENSIVWFEELKKRLEYLDIEGIKNLINVFFWNFDKINQNNLRERIVREKIIEKSKLKEIEKDYLYYKLKINLGPEKEKLIREIRDRKNLGEVGEEFIEKYMELKYFSLYGKKLWLEDVKKPKNKILYYFQKIWGGEHKYRKITKIMKLFEIKKKKKFYTVLLEGTFLLMKSAYYFILFCVFGKLLFFSSSEKSGIAEWSFYLFFISSSIIMLIEFLGVVLEKNFEISKENSMNKFLIPSTLANIVIMLLIHHNFLLSGLLFLFLILILLRRIVLSRIRYKKLEKLAKEIVQKGFLYI